MGEENGRKAVFLAVADLATSPLGSPASARLIAMASISFIFH